MTKPYIEITANILSSMAVDRQSIIFFQGKGS